MLHSPPQPSAAEAEGGAPTTHVLCRARTWRVLDMQRDRDVTTWRLACEAERPRLIASPPDEVSAVSARVRRVSRRAWVRAACAHARSGHPSWWPGRVAHLPISLLPWQCVPAMMILSGHHRRVLVADALGMGKTVQAGVLIHEVHAREPDAATLVVTPPGLIAQWTSELRSRTLMEPSVLDATALRREAAQAPAFVDASRAGACWLVSVDLLRQPDVIALLARTRWTLLVVDEAHLVSPGSAREAAVVAVARASVRIVLLTATPAAGGPTSAEALRRLGGHAGERPMPVLRREASVLARPPRRSCLLRVRLDSAHDALCRRLDAFVARARQERGADGLLPALVLRRRAASCPWALRRSLERRRLVLGEAAPVVDATLPGLFDAAPAFDQDAEDEALMRLPAWADSQAERRELDRLLALTLRLPPDGRKLRAVSRLVRRCGQPVVIFTAFLDTLRALRPLLPSTGLVVVHGQQPDVLRTEAIDAFVTGRATILLATDAAAEGLNLHARCRLVVHAEVPASARVLEQRNGRLDRYGQARRVHAIVMASRVRDDIDALERLRRRTDEGDAWMARVAPRRCRRSLVARATLQRQSSARALTATPAHAAATATTLLHCVLRHRRWRRLAAALDVPAGMRRLRAVTVRVAGGPELTSTRLPMLLLDDGTAAWRQVAVAARRHAVARGHIARARRLARRLAVWERLVALSLSDTHRSSPSSLFDDAGERAPHLPVARDETKVWVAVDPVAVISTDESVS